ncbi:hypothetical protein LVJ94_08955 [Pendulispora rubella]|uniref:Uncharacterized protein n=1 Tax=Pendulispora rubella TaxID=2741070 RepID=A0ABZ2LBR4_9BACT
MGEGFAAMVHSVTPMVAISVEKTIFWKIAVEREHQLVRLIRTPAPYVELTDINASFVQVDRALHDIDRRSWRLLVDLRDGPRRNDTEFEAQMDRYRKSLVTSFRRTALVVKSATGLLQVKRHMHEDGALHAAVFMSEIQAMQYLEHGH